MKVILDFFHIASTWKRVINDHLLQVLFKPAQWSSLSKNCCRILIPYFNLNLWIDSITFKSINWANGYEYNGLWSMIDKFNMNLACDIYEMVGGW